MKVISVWQPYASLAAHGFKLFETRGWPAPKSVIGQVIGIASTKRITPEQRDAMADPAFREYYDQTGLPELDELAHGYLLGTALLHSCELITPDWIDDVTDEEKLFGWWNGESRYGWRLRHAKPLEHPIPIVGKQGLFDWRGFDEPHQETQAQSAAAL